MQIDSSLEASARRRRRKQARCSKQGRLLAGKKRKKTRKRKKGMTRSGKSISKELYDRAKKVPTIAIFDTRTGELDQQSMNKWNGMAKHALGKGKKNSRKLRDTLDAHDERVIQQGRMMEMMMKMQCDFDLKIEVTFGDRKRFLDTVMLEQGFEDPKKFDCYRKLHLGDIISIGTNIGLQMQKGWEEGYSIDMEDYEKQQLWDAIYDRVNMFHNPQGECDYGLLDRVAEFISLFKQTRAN